MRVVSVRPAKSEGYLSVTLMAEEKKRLTVSEADYAEAGMPMARDEVGTRDYLILLASDENYRATLLALRILSYSDNNEKTAASDNKNFFIFVAPFNQRMVSTKG